MDDPFLATEARAVVLIRDPETGELIAECSGPGPDGSCPLAMSGSVVPCAGYRIHCERDGGTRRRRAYVSSASAECPLAWLSPSWTPPD